MHSAGGSAGKGSSASHVARFEGVDNAPEIRDFILVASANTTIQDLARKITFAVQQSVREARQQQSSFWPKPEPCARPSHRVKRFAGSCPAAARLPSLISPVQENLDGGGLGVVN